MNSIFESPGDLQALAAWLPRQRWFGAKARGIARVGVVDVVRLAGGRTLVVDVEGDDGGVGRYAVPVLEGDGIRDALADAPFCRALLALLAGGGAVAGERGEIRGAPAAELRERWPGGPPADLSVRRLGGEQSNTSVVLGEILVLKHFRRLAEGLNPDAEITRFLTERTSFRNVPRLAGHLEYRDGAGRVTTLAVVQALVPDGVDGWQWVLSRLREPGDLDADRLVTEALRRLGQRTGELHLALTGDGHDPAFAPEPIDAADVAAWRDAIAAQLAAARGVLRGEALAVDPGAVDAALAPLVGRRKIRHHGDFHLGQTLYRPGAGDWMILDFEGEPSRPLAERRRKHAALRDVAGMLRSLDYAAVSARPDDVAAARAWETRAARAFTEGYRSVVAGASFLPPSEGGFSGAVAVFELEKAAYEIVYEANNRPDWVGIPTGGLLRALARLRREGGAGAA